jgi:hypothetical protein
MGYPFGLPVAGSVAVSPELLDPFDPTGSVAGRGGWPSPAGRWFSFSVWRGGRAGSVMVKLLLRTERSSHAAGSQTFRSPRHYTVAKRDPG